MNLAKAMNTTTGKFDLSAFDKAMTQSNMNIQQVQTSLSSLGPEGNQAFLSFAKAIATAEAPTTRLNKSLVAFGDTLKRTMLMYSEIL